jgi:RsiW-degrading membrane proteinase PrsW (M82 family)
MTRRSKLIGYYHAILTTAWFSVAANDTSQIVNGLLGDKACAVFSLFLVVPLTWLPAMFYGFPLFPSMTEHYVWMSIIGAVVILNGLLIGYCLDRILNWVGIPDSSIKPKRTKKAEQDVHGNTH